MEDFIKEVAHPTIHQRLEKIEAQIKDIHNLFVIDPNKKEKDLLLESLKHLYVDLCLDDCNISANLMIITDELKTQNDKIIKKLEETINKLNWVLTWIKNHSN